MQVNDEMNKLKNVGGPMKKILGCKLISRPILGITPPSFKKNKKLRSFCYDSKNLVSGTKGTRSCVMMGIGGVKM